MARLSQVRINGESGTAEANQAGMTDTKLQLTLDKKYFIKYNMILVVVY